MRHPFILMATFALLVLAAPDEAAARSEGIVAKPSAFSVKQTIDKLEAVLKSKGFKIFARVDHGADAAAIGRELAPSEVLIFGTPKINVPLMRADIHAGIDLPLRALAYEDDQGQVYLIYDHPGYIAKRHEIKGKNKLVGAISRIMTNLTDQAVKDK